MRKGRKLFTNLMTLHCVQGRRGGRGRTNFPVQFSSASGQEIDESDAQ